MVAEPIPAWRAAKASASRSAISVSSPERVIMVPLTPSLMTQASWGRCTAPTGRPAAIVSSTEKGMPSNSIVDSGTNSLNLGPALLKAIFAKFTANQQALLQASVFEGRVVAASDLDLATWPALTFVLQGDAGDVSLRVAASDYWQVDAEKVGAALAAITVGTEGLAILGLPLMNGYFTIFDGEADNGKGAIKFATRK